MNTYYEIGKHALIEIICEMEYELYGIDTEILYNTLVLEFTDYELINYYGLIYDEYYNKNNK